MDKAFLTETAKRVRIDVIRALERAGSGHPGGRLPVSTTISLSTVSSRAIRKN